VCRAARQALIEDASQAEGAALDRVIQGMSEGRRIAHELKVSERNEKDARLRNHWSQYSANGWSPEEIVKVLAERFEVKPDTVLRRARRLGLVPDG
jgi:hypothetical protein